MNILNVQNSVSAIKTAIFNFKFFELKSAVLFNSKNIHLKFNTKLHSFYYRFKRMRLAEQLQKRSDNLNNLNSLEDGEGENETGIDGR